MLNLFALAVFIASIKYSRDLPILANLTASESFIANKNSSKRKYIVKFWCSVVKFMWVQKLKIKHGQRKSIS